MQSCGRRGTFPVPLIWDRQRFTVTLGGQSYQVYGHTSPPFASFRGTVDEPDSYRGTRRFLLLYLPENRVLATLPSLGQVKALASTLAREWGRSEGLGEGPPGRPAVVATSSRR